MHLKFIFKAESFTSFSKIGLAMRLTGFFLLVCLMQTSAATFGQTVTLHKKDASLKEILKDVRAQTGYNFIYSNRTIRDIPTLTISGTNMDLKEVLEKALLEQGLTYSINKKVIVLKKEVHPLPAREEEIVSEPERQVTGTVVDSTSGEPLAGVTIRVQGTNNGTVTDGEGKFTLTADDDAVLDVSFVGYSGKTMPLRGRTTIHILLSSTATGLDQLVVIGYGSVKSKDLTGSVSSIKGDDLQSIPASGVNQILGGRAAGVEVTNTSGQPGASSVIRIRGGNSFQGDNNPLYVVDGVIVGQDYNLNNLNISDIESINVLKDATAIAIYGTRGSNGVVLITTKSGKSSVAGYPKININIYGGSQLFVNSLNFLDGKEFAEYANEDAQFRGVALPFSNINEVPNTNWIDLVTHNASVYNADVSISGASSNSKLNYYISGGYFNQDGVIKNSRFVKYNLTTNFDLKLSDYVSFGLRNQFVNKLVNNNKVNFGGGEGSLVHGIVPARAIFESNGQYTSENPVSTTVQRNPIADINLREDKNYETYILTSLFLKIDPTSNLSFKTSLSPTIDLDKHNFYNPGSLPENRVINAGGSGGISTTRTLNLLNENTITYNPKIGVNQDLNVLAGFTWQTQKLGGVDAEGFSYFSDDQTFNNLGSGSDPTRNQIGSSFDYFQLVSWLGRINYSYKDRYLLTLVGRIDGSSRFAPGNKYGFFPAAAVAWRLNKEDFINQLNFFDDLRLKVSYGQSGSQAIPSFRTLALLDPANTSFNGVSTSGVTLGRPANPFLRWETTDEFDLGLSMTILRNRLTLDMDFYDKRTKDLLSDLQIPKQSGFDTRLENVGSLRNRGIDLSISSVNISSDLFKWTTTLNLSGNRNMVLDLGGDDFINLITPTNQGGPGARLVVGQSAPIFMGVNYLGTWKSQQEIEASGQQGQIIGGPHFEDTNHDGQVSVDDFHKIGSPQPILQGGMQNSIKYKNLTLSFFIQGTYGNDIFNTLTQTAFFGTPSENKYKSTLKRWTPDNINSDIPRAGAIAEFSQIFNNSMEVEDGSYLRLKNVNLSYSLPLTRWGGFWKNFDDVSVYFSGENLLLISSFQLFDPETSKYNNTNEKYKNVIAGFADGAYPYSKTLTFGMNITL